MNQIPNVTSITKKNFDPKKIFKDSHETSLIIQQAILLESQFEQQFKHIALTVHIDTLFSGNWKPNHFFKFKTGFADLYGGVPSTLSHHQAFTDAWCEDRNSYHSNKKAKAKEEDWFKGEKANNAAIWVVICIFKEKHKNNQFADQSIAIKYAEIERFKNEKSHATKIIKGLAKNAPIDGGEAYFLSNITTALEVLGAEKHLETLKSMNKEGKSLMCAIKKTEDIKKKRSISSKKEYLEISRPITSVGNK